MISEFKICKSGACGVTLTGLELDGGGYLDEDNNVTSKRAYKWNESVTINFIYTIDSKENEVFETYQIKDHNLFPIDDSTFIMKKDGLYGLGHIILPTQVWLDKVIALNPDELFDFYEEIYYYNTEDELLYKYINQENRELITINDFLNIKATEDSTIIRSDKNTFNLCYISDCFYKICKNLLNKLTSKCSVLSNNATRDRDILWMIINAVKYAVDTRQLYEAQRILENSTQCLTICTTLTTTKSKDCGCN